MNTKSKEDDKERYKECPVCNGKGTTEHRKTWQQEPKKCKCMFCDGTGKLKIGKVS